MLLLPLQVHSTPTFGKSHRTRIQFIGTYLQIQFSCTLNSLLIKFAVQFPNVFNNTVDENLTIESTNFPHLASKSHSKHILYVPFYKTNIAFANISMLKFITTLIKLFFCFASLPSLFCLCSDVAYFL